MSKIGPSTSITTTTIKRGVITAWKYPRCSLQEASLDSRESSFLMVQRARFNLEDAANVSLSSAIQPDFVIDRITPLFYQRCVKWQSHLISIPTAEYDATLKAYKIRVRDVVYVPLDISSDPTKLMGLLRRSNFGHPTGPLISECTEVGSKLEEHPLVLAHLIKIGHTAMCMHVHTSTNGVHTTTTTRLRKMFTYYPVPDQRVDQLWPIYEDDPGLLMFERFTHPLKPLEREVVGQLASNVSVLALECRQKINRQMNKLKRYFMTEAEFRSFVGLDEVYRWLVKERRIYELVRIGDDPMEVIVDSWSHAQQRVILEHTSRMWNTPLKDLMTARQLIKVSGCEELRTHLLSKDQYLLLLQILMEGFVCINSGPGCGKTWVMVLALSILAAAQPNRTFYMPTVSGINFQQNLKSKFDELENTANFRYRPIQELIGELATSAAAAVAEGGPVLDMYADIDMDMDMDFELEEGDAGAWDLNIANDAEFQTMSHFMRDLFKIYSVGMKNHRDSLDKKTKEWWDQFWSSEHVKKHLPRDDPAVLEFLKISDDEKSKARKDLKRRLSISDEDGDSDGDRDSGSSGSSEDADVDSSECERGEDGRDDGEDDEEDDKPKRKRGSSSSSTSKKRGSTGKKEIAVHNKRMRLLLERIAESKKNGARGGSGDGDGVEDATTTGIGGDGGFITVGVNRNIILGTVSAMLCQEHDRQRECGGIFVDEQLVAAEDVATLLQKFSPRRFVLGGDINQLGPIGSESLARAMFTTATTTATTTINPELRSPRAQLLVNHRVDGGSKKIIALINAFDKGDTGKLNLGLNWIDTDSEAEWKLALSEARKSDALIVLDPNLRSKVEMACFKTHYPGIKYGELRPGMQLTAKRNFKLHSVLPDLLNGETLTIHEIWGYNPKSGGSGGGGDWTSIPRVDTKNLNDPDTTRDMQDLALVFKEGGGKIAHWEGRRTWGQILQDSFEYHYVSTVMRKQGSEENDVVIVADFDSHANANSNHYFYSREAYFSAITRAKRSVRFIGSKDHKKRFLEAISNRAASSNTNTNNFTFSPEPRYFRYRSHLECGFDQLFPGDRAADMRLRAEPSRIKDFFCS